MTAEQSADKIIEMLQENGLTPEQMLEVIEMTKEKFERMKSKQLDLFKTTTV